MKTLCRICLGTAAGLALAGCSQKFKSAEKEIINAGDGGIMRVLTVTDRSDSLTLRRKSAPMAEGMERSDDYETLRRRMLATVRDPENTGVGIAAPQVGILRRMIAVQRFDKPGEPFEIYLNPEIVEYSAETAPGREGCLSIPGCYGEVTRAQQIVLRYRDEQFAERTERIGGFTAVIFQHEVDHLDGILYTDRMDGTPLQRESSSKRRKKFRPQRIRALRTEKYAQKAERAYSISISTASVATVWPSATKICFTVPA